jgi:CRP-like cAMP-binding protein
MSLSESTISGLYTVGERMISLNTEEDEALLAQLNRIDETEGDTLNTMGSMKSLQDMTFNTNDSAVIKRFFDSEMSSPTREREKFDSIYDASTIFSNSVMSEAGWQNQSLDRNEIAEILRIPKQDRSTDQWQSVLSWISAVWPMAEVLGPKRAAAMSRQLHYQQFEPGQDIVTEGERGSIFYIIVNGSCDIIKSTVGVVATLGKGKSFGEMALTSDDDLRTATVRCATAVETVSLNKEEFNVYVRAMHTEETTANFKLFKHCRLFEKWSRKRLEALSRASRRKIFRADEYIFRQGDESDFTYVLVSGKVSIYKDIVITNMNRWPNGMNSWESVGRKVIKSILVASLEKPGDYFGELSVINGGQRQANVIAKTKVVVCMVSKNELLHLMHRYFLRIPTLLDTSLDTTPSLFLSFFLSLTQPHPTTPYTCEIHFSFKDSVREWKVLKKNILSKFRKAQEKEETDKSQQDDEGAIYDSRKDYEDDMHLLRRLGSNEFGGGPSSVASTNNARLAMADITAERAKEKRKAALAVKYSSNPLEKMRRDKKRKERDKQREIEKQKQREKEAFKAAPGKPMLSRALTSTLDMALLNSNNTESDTDDEDLKLVTIETIAKVNKKVHEDREVQRKDHEFHKMRERGRDQGSDWRDDNYHFAVFKDEIYELNAIEEINHHEAIKRQAELERAEKRRNMQQKTIRTAQIARQLAQGTNVFVVGTEQKSELESYEEEGIIESRGRGNATFPDDIPDPIDLRKRHRRVSVSPAKFRKDSSFGETRDWRMLHDKPQHHSMVEMAQINEHLGRRLSVLQSMNHKTEHSDGESEVMKAPQFSSNIAIPRRDSIRNNFNDNYSQASRTGSMRLGSISVGGRIGDRRNSVEPLQQVVDTIHESEENDNIDSDVDNIASLSSKEVIHRMRRGSTAVNGLSGAVSTLDNQSKWKSVMGSMKAVLALKGTKSLSFQSPVEISKKIRSDSRSRTTSAASPARSRTASAAFLRNRSFSNSGSSASSTSTSPRSDDEGPGYSLTVGDDSIDHLMKGPTGQPQGALLLNETEQDLQMKLEMINCTSDMNSSSIVSQLSVEESLSELLSTGPPAGDNNTLFFKSTKKTPAIVESRRMWDQRNRARQNIAKSHLRYHDVLRLAGQEDIL